MNVSLSSLPVFGTPASPIAGSSDPASAGFSGALRSAIGNVEAAQSVSRSAASDLLLNGEGDVHTVALAAQNAELSLELFQQVRNKFVAAYQEIMKMPM
jgi:flagellar hook-basal body complex protein FliE